MTTRCLLALLFGSTACGDALVDGAYRGEPLYTISGWVQLQLSPDTLDADAAGNGGELRLAVFWSPPKGEGFRLELASEQAVETTGVFPARFEMALYEPPSDALLRAVSDGQGELATAVLLAYLDADHDGRWDRDSERLIGGANDRLIVYTPGGFKSSQYGEVGAGFHRLRTAGSDCANGGVFFKPDPEPRVDLIVGMAFPSDVLPDANCDGAPKEWAGLCPPLAQVREVCRDSGAPDSSMCPACEGLLWPLGVDPATCDAWFQSCLFGAPAAECNSEYDICVGKNPGPAPDEACDLKCVCYKYLDACRAEGSDETSCQERFEKCLSPAP